MKSVPIEDLSAVLAASKEQSYSTHSHERRRRRQGPAVLLIYSLMLCHSDPEIFAALYLGV